MVLKQQKETRTKDGRRRITPLMIASPLDLRFVLVQKTVSFDPSEGLLNGRFFLVASIKPRKVNTT